MKIHYAGAHEKLMPGCVNILRKDKMDLREFSQLARGVQGDFLQLEAGSFFARSVSVLAPDFRLTCRESNLAYIQRFNNHRDAIYHSFIDASNQPYINGLPVEPH